MNGNFGILLRELELTTNRILALIPARGGSKRLPRKNLLPLAGKPLIAWTIEAAKKSKYINTVCVSTDDIELQSVALEYGAEVPFLRPAYLANDIAKSTDVAIHALDWYKQQGKVFDTLILLQPTSPLRTTEDIDNAIKLYVEKEACSVTSVCETEHSPLWTNILPSDLSMDYFIRSEIKNSRSQDLPTYYRLNGAIYIVKSDTLYDTKSFIAEKGSFAYIMSQENSIDIDTKLDFYLVESIRCLNL